MMFHVEKWWAWQGLNLRPLRCQGRGASAFPLKSAVFRCSNERTARERKLNRGNGYRSLTAPLSMIVRIYNMTHEQHLMIEFFVYGLVSGAFGTLSLCVGFLIPRRNR